jgi:hypothetical protein
MELRISQIYSYIWGVGVKIVYVLKVYIHDTRITTAFIGNAINVGAVRGHIDTDPLLIEFFEIFLIDGKTHIFF